MDVDMAVVRMCERMKTPIVWEDTDVDPLPNTSSTITIKLKERPPIDPIPVTATSSMGSEHKSSSVSTAKRIVRYHQVCQIFTTHTDHPLIKQLPPTPISRPPFPSQPYPLQHQTSDLKPPPPITKSLSIPQGTILEIGIPCITASKRKRFKAYARCINEMEGEIGASWVGAEMPMPFGDSVMLNDDNFQGDISYIHRWLVG